MAQRTVAGWLNPFPVSLLYALIGAVWIFATLILFAEWFPEPELLKRWELAISFAGLLLTAGFVYFLIRQTEASLRRSQESLQRVNRALKARSECSQAMIRATDEGELMDDICRIIVETEGYQLAWVGFAEHDVEKSVRPVAQWGYENGYLETIKVSWGENEHGHGPTGIAIRTGRPAVAQHILTDPRWAPWREKALKYGYAASISLPLSADGQVFAALVIFAGEPDSFDAQEVKLLAGLAEDLSFGIATLRIRRERERGRNERRLLAAIIEQETDGILTFRADGLVLYVNPAFEAIGGLSREEIVGKNIQEFVAAGANQNFFQAMAETLATGQGRVERLVNRRKDGTNHNVEVKISSVSGPSLLAYSVVIRDLTNEVRLERQLLQAQKLEAIATLAGGISHDFNNILAAIITNTEMAMDQVADGSDLQEHLAIIMKAGLRARNLVKQILTLSNQGEKERQPVRIGLIVKECLKLLRASLPATIEIVYQSGDDRGLVLADPTQMHQVIMNLCTNAADAMREGGTLQVRTARIDLPTNDSADAPQLPPGPYLRLTVADTGHGMEPCTMERIFDPFFTTKEPGRGTGLGLSVVHGIVKSHKGGISYGSEIGKGTSFHIYLPRLEQGDNAGEDRPAKAPLPAGRGRILFLDDEEDIVFSMQKMLEGLGYEVVAGTDSREGLEVFRAQPERFDLVITDQTMPHLTGDKLAREILHVRPDIPILLCTGMGAMVSGGIGHQAAASGIRAILRKPLERNELAAAIRRALEE